jgi:hypothetical protein
MGDGRVHVNRRRCAPRFLRQEEGTLKRAVSAVAVLATAVTAALAFGVTGGQAGLITGLLSCPGTYSQPFAPWGDSSSYTPAPGGSFEGWNSWSLAGGAKVVGGNEPFYVGSRTDSHSVQLTPGSSALSPPVCLGTLDPTMRLFVRSSDGSPVHVDIYGQGLLGLVKLGYSTDLAASTAWGPSPKTTLLLDNVLALTSLGKTVVYFRFSSTGSATAQIDDVYVDPVFHE